MEIDYPAFWAWHDHSEAGRMRPLLRTYAAPEVAAPASASRAATIVRNFKLLSNPAVEG